MLKILFFVVVVVVFSFNIQCFSVGIISETYIL